MPTRLIGLDQSKSSRRRRAPLGGAGIVDGANARCATIDFFAFLDVIPDPTVVVDQGGQIVALNALAVKFFGYELNELRGRPIEVLLPDQLHAVHQNHFARFREHPQTRPMGSGLELVARRQDGRVIPVEISLGVLPGPTGFYVASVVRDISERKRVDGALRALARASTPSARSAPFFAEMLRAVAANLGLSFAWVVERVDEVTARVIAEHSDDASVGEVSFSLEGTPCANVLRDGRPCFYPRDVTKLFPQSQFLARLGVESYAGVPLFGRDGRAIGVLVVMDRKPLSETGLILPVLDTLAVRFAAELERNVLQIAEEEARQEATLAHAEVVALYDATKQVTQSLDLSTTLQNIVEAAIRLTSSSTVGIALPVADGTGVRYAAAGGQQFPSILRDRTIRYGEGGTGIAAQSGVVVNVADAARDPRSLLHDRGDLGENRSMLFIPLKSGDRVIGVLSAASSTVAFFTPGREQLLRGLAEQAALAVEHAREVAERKHAEEALRRSEQLYRTLIERSNDIVAIFGRDRMLRYISPSIERVLGYSRESLLGQNPFDLVHPDDRATTNQALDDVLAADGATGRARARVRAQDGSWRLLDVVIMNLTDETVVHGLLATMRDITEQNDLEERLRQSQKMEAIGQLAGGVAHDFNNLLSVILGFGEMLLDEIGPDAGQRERLGMMLAAGESAVSLTRQLLAFSRRAIVEPKETDLNSIVEQLSRMLRRLISEDISSTLSLAANLGIVKVDPGQIEQVLLNLATNARDAMPRGGTLTIETANVTFDQDFAREHPEVQPGPHVMLAVRDTGIGMDPATQARIFEPFFTTKEVGKGTGVGLAVVYGIVKQNDGWISVDSAPGQGTTFRIYLPRVMEPTRSGSGSDDSAPPPRGSETILLVEDASNLRELARAALEASGYRVLAAEDGKGAFRLMEDHRDEIHLLLTDVVLPGMSGREIANLLVTRSPGLKVLFMSGYTDDLVIHQGALGYGHAFLQKPFTPRVLSRRVREVLDTPPTVGR